MKTSLVVAYRENDLFNRYLPTVAQEIATKLNLQLHLHTYPSSLSADEARVGVREYVKSLESGSFYLLTDSTCRIRNTDNDLINHVWKNDRIDTIDTVFMQILMERVFTESFEEGLKVLMKTMFPNTSHVVICKQNIADHDYEFVWDKTLLGSSTNSDDEDTIFADALNAILRKAFPDANIVIGDEIDIKEDTLFVCDRHYLAVCKQERRRLDLPEKTFLLPVASGLDRLTQKFDKSFFDTLELVEKMIEMHNIRSL